MASQELLEACRALVVRERVRLASFFEPFDLHKRLVVTLPQAARALSTAGLRLSPAQESALRKWESADGRFFYHDFVTEVSKGLGELKGLERDPDFDLTATQVPGAQMAGHPPHPSDEALARLPGVLSAVARQCRVRGVPLHSFLHQFDKTGRGMISPEQLLRALQMAVPHISREDADVLIECYTWDGGSSASRVSARQIINAVRVAEAAMDPPKAVAAVTRAAPKTPVPVRSAPDHKRSSSSSSVRDTLALVRRQTLERRIRLRDAFKDYDPLHRGAVTLPQFVRALRALPFSGLSAAAAEALGRAYPDSRVVAGRDSAMVDYREVCNEVETAFGMVQGVERRPTEEPPKYGETAGLSVPRGTVSGAIVAEAVNEMPDMTADELGALDRALRWIRSRIRQRRLELVTTFQDFDRAHEEHVTIAQFLRALRILGLYPAAEDEAEALVTRFRGRGATRSEMVHWRSFRNAVDDVITDEADAKATSAADSAPRAPPSDKAVPLSDPRMLLARIKTWAVRDNVRVGAFVADLDPLRHGAVSGARLAAALSAAGFRMEPGDEEALIAAYSDPQHGYDALGRPLVCRTSFERDVDAAFGPAGLERDPDADVEGMRASALTSTLSLRGRDRELRLSAPAHDVSELVRSMSLGGSGVPQPSTLIAAAAASVKGAGRRLSAAETKELLDALHVVSTWARTRRVEMVPVFLGFDKHQHGVLPPSQARRCIATLKMPLFDHGVDVAFKAFATPGADGRDDVSWAWLLAAVEDPERVVAALPPRGAHLTKAGAIQARATVAPGMGLAGAERMGETLLASRLREEAREGSAMGLSDEGLEGALNHVRRLCAARRVTLKEHLSAHDPLNLGRVSKAKLRVALSTAGVSLPPRVLGALESGFEVDGDSTMVRWRDLSESVDGGGRHAALLEKDPLAPLVNPLSFAKPLADGVVADDDKVASVFPLLSDLARQALQRRVDLKPRFHDYDRQRRGTVTKARFKAVLASEFRNITGAQMDLLADAFESGDAPGMTAWRPFLARVEPPSIG
jgi:Ca2+-binding EF-hand superfamily protein